MKKFMIAPALIAVALSMAGCATTGKLTDQQRLELYRSHAGEPVPSIRYFGSFIGWTSLGDRALALQTRPSEHWLLELYGPCQNLDFASTIGLTSRMNQVDARFDRVLVRDGFPGGCRIATIRPLDAKAIKAEMSELRKAEAAERADGQEAAGQ